MKRPRGVCGKTSPVEAMIYSRHTKTHYCTNLNKCKPKKGPKQ